MPLATILHELYMLFLSGVYVWVSVVFLVLVFGLSLSFACGLLVRCPFFAGCFPGFCPSCAWLLLSFVGVWCVP